MRLKDVVRERQRMLMAEIDYKRALKDVRGEVNQVELAEALGISQPAVAKALKACESTPDVREPFAAGSAMELCQRYAAGMLSRDETVRQLSEWPFDPYRSANEFGEYEQDQSNAFMQVELAADFGLIDDAMYEEVVKRRIAG